MQECNIYDGDDDVDNVHNKMKMSRRNNAAGSLFISVALKKTILVKIRNKNESRKKIRKKNLWIKSFWNQFHIQCMTKSLPYKYSFTHKPSYKFNFVYMIL